MCNSNHKGLCNAMLLLLLLVIMFLNRHFISGALKYLCMYVHVCVCVGACVCASANIVLEAAQANFVVLFTVQ